MYQVLVEEVRTGRVLCMPELTAQERAVICAKRTYEKESELPVEIGGFEYSKPVVRLGVYPAILKDGVQYYAFPVGTSITVDDPRGSVGND